MRKSLTVCLTLLVCSAMAQEDNIVNIDKNYEVNAKGTLYLNSDDADVKITGSDRSDVHLKLFHKKTVKGFQFGDYEFNVDIEEKDGNLYIKDFEKGTSGVIAGYIREDYKITLEIPNGMNLNIIGDDDDYTVQGVNGAITMHVDDSDAQFRNCKGDRFDFDFDDGDIDMDIASGILKLDLDDGDFHVERASFTEIEADADDGGIYIKTSLADNGSYRFHVDDGTVDVGVIAGGGQFDIYHDGTHISTSDAFDKTEDHENRTSYQLSKGTAKVKVRTDDGRVRLRTI